MIFALIPSSPTHQAYAPTDVAVVDAESKPGSWPAGTWIVVNFPVWYLYHDSWMRFFQLNSERPIDWGTLWYIGQNVPHVLWPGSGLPVIVG